MVAHAARRTFSRPRVRVNSVPCLADRVGNAESNVSTPSRGRRPHRRLVADAEQMVRSIVRYPRREKSQHVRQLVRVPAERTPDGEPVEGKRAEVLRAHLSQLAIHPAVNHRVHRLSANVREVCPETSRLPSMTEVHASLQDVAVDVIGGKLVERDDDVRAQRLLRGDGRFGREEDASAVAVALEEDALLVHAEDEPRGVFVLGRTPGFELVGVVGGGVREGEHLETAAVGDDGGVAADEAVEAAGIGDALGAGLEHEVVGIGEHQVETGFREGLVGDSLERAVRADRHEPRGLDDAVGGVWMRPTRAAERLDSCTSSKRKKSRGT